MKKVSLVVAALFGLVSFSAFAGGSGNCLYGHDKTIAESAVEDTDNSENIDPQFLALLKKQKAEKELVKPIETYN